MNTELSTGGARTVAVEEHCWTPALRDALLRDGGDDSVAFSAAAMDARLIDLSDARLGTMDDAGIDMQVLSATTPGTQPLQAAEAIALAREHNDVVAAAVAAHPERFAGFATLPTPDPQAAAEELRRAVANLGLVGAMVFPRSGDLRLDDASFRPIFEAAAELAVPLFLHPQIPPKPVRDAYFTGFGEEIGLGLATAGWGWHHDAGLAGLRLILAGTFDRHPQLQLILGHWGEMLVSFVDRADLISNSATHLQRPVGEYVASNIHVTGSGILSHRMLLNAIATVGADRVMFASDYPYHISGDGAARAFLDSAPISREDKTKIGSRNAERLLRLAPSSS